MARGENSSSAPSPTGTPVLKNLPSTLALLKKGLHGSKKAGLWLLRGGENDEIGFFQWSQHLMSTWYL
jgi:hypothetical protein